MAQQHPGSQHLLLNPNSAQGTQGDDFSGLEKLNGYKIKTTERDQCLFKGIYSQDLGLMLLPLTTSGSFAGFA